MISVKQELDDGHIVRKVWNRSSGAVKLCHGLNLLGLKHENAQHRSKSDDKYDDDGVGQQEGEQRRAEQT